MVPSVCWHGTGTYALGRQPQHIALAGALGLGNFDKTSSPRGRRYLIQHKTVTL
ncbi:MAG: hypothetical protein ABSE84_22960 [Isosphaeraceae bacterium]